MEAAAEGVYDAQPVEKLEVTELEILSVWKFVLLSVASLCIYPLWWMYKSWRFIKYKENLDIMPVWRVIFAIFYIIALFGNIKYYATTLGYKKDYNSGLMLVFIIACNFLGRLPDPYWILALTSCAFYIPALQAQNFALEHDEEILVTKRDGFTNKQVVILVVGGIWWALILIGLFVAPEATEVLDMPTEIYE